MAGCGMALSSMYLASRYKVELAKRLGLREQGEHRSSIYNNREDGRVTILVGY
jgi:hypothetical protein